MKLKSTYKYDPRIHGVSQSQIGTWQECKERARLAITNGWTSKYPATPLIYGSLAHSVIAAGVTSGLKSHAEVVKRIPEWQKNAEHEWRQENANPTQDALRIVEECQAIIGMIMPYYFKKWWTDDFTVYEWHHVEAKFSIPIEMPDGAVVPMVGRFDGVFKKKGKWWLKETKNKGRWSDRLSDLLPLDLQVGYYLTAIQHEMKVYPVGAVYNLLRRPGEKRKQDETLPAFVKRIGENVRKKPDHYFERFQMEMSRAEIDMHIARARQLVREFYLWWKEQPRDSRCLTWNSGACENKYGTCPMLNICANQDYSAHYIRRDVSPELRAP